MVIAPLVMLLVLAYQVLLLVPAASQLPLLAGLLLLTDVLLLLVLLGPFCLCHNYKSGRAQQAP